jgi:predicted AAA+ superfamily ATPase
MKEFAKTEYTESIYVNFEFDEDMKTLFEADLNPERILLHLKAFSGIEAKPHTTLIIFDEIQEANRGLTSLKYFSENAPEYHIISAGSLLGITLHQHVSFPVGKVDFLDLFPLNFYEFLCAIGQERFAELLKEKDFQMITSFKTKYIEWLRQYFYVGGMPEAVATFAENRDWQKTRQVHNKILLAYERDFSKHAPKEIFPRIKMVWQSIPSQLAKENRKFIYGLIKEGARAKEFELAIQWLLDSGLLIQCFRNKEPKIPLNAYQDLSAFKLYHNDIGLLGAMSKLSPRTVIEGNLLFTEYKGIFAEQFIIQQLKLNNNFSIFYFAPDTYSMEVDFIIQNENDEVIPIEVKAETNLKAKSFKYFCEKYKPTKAIRTSLADYKEENWMTNLPLYAINMI